MHTGQSKLGWNYRSIDILSSYLDKSVLVRLKHDLGKPDRPASPYFKSSSLLTKVYPKYSDVALNQIGAQPIECSPK